MRRVSAMRWPFPGVPGHESDLRAGGALRMATSMLRRKQFWRDAVCMMMRSTSVHAFHMWQSCKLWYKSTAFCALP
jgi:hypothetical protein